MCLSLPISIDALEQAIPRLEMSIYIMSLSNVILINFGKSPKSMWYRMFRNTFINDSDILGLILCELVAFV